jgi:phenylpropionate dioxygenase-like ring-hydroxylating dioxygenase large terminal subunit
MSNLPRSRAELAQATPQLPVSWYFDPEVYALEQSLLFANGPGYVGHELMVPGEGDYQTLEWMDHAKMLVRNANGVELMHNICRHRQAVMMQGRGTQKNFVCPLHRWTYDTEGQLIGAPHFARTPCKSLGKTPLQNWNGLLFAGRRDVQADLAKLGVKDFDFSGYVYDRTVITQYRQNWKTFIEVYLEDYHVEPFHPGLGQFVQCADLRWEFGEQYSVQTVGVKDSLMKPGSPTYAKWHDAVRGFRQGKDPDHGAIWMVYYPNIMLEWYPHVLVISTLIPRGPQLTTNVVEFYYPEEIALFEREFVEAEQAAYLETAAEDDEIAVRMDAGRKLLLEMGEDDAGPYQSPMEDGMVHFHEYVRRQLGERV